MSLALTANFVEQQNLVVPLAGISNSGLSVRVASAGSGSLGTLVAGGAASTITWALSQNPTWVTLSVSADTLTAAIGFSNAQVQPTAYQFYISATDGVTTVYFPIFLEVRPPFSIAATSQATNFNIQSYDSTVADIVFQGVGLNGIVDSNVSFIPPATLPPGLKFITSDGNSMLLRVAEPSGANVAGGTTLYQGGPVSTQVVLRAYCPGTLYDNPGRCYTQAFTVESLSAKLAVVDIGVSMQYSAILGAFVLDSFVDFLEGAPQPFTYQWQITGTATGTVTSGGSSASSSLAWVPSTPGTVGFVLNLLNPTTSAVISQVVVPATPCAPAGTWEGTNALKLSLDSPNARGYAEDSPTVAISTPSAELGAEEIVTINLTFSAASTVEAAATLVETQVTLSQTNPSATVALTIPSSTINQKWIVTASATNTGATRSGHAQATFLSNGGQPLAINTSVGTSLTSNVGQPLPPITLTALNAEDVLVSGATFSLCGAPDGLFIANGILSGNVLSAGTYTFEIVADAAGYSRGYMGPVTLVASAYDTPLAISSVQSSVASLPDNQQFAVSWGYSGTVATLNMIQGYLVRSVLGSTSAVTSEVGCSVITIYGTSFYGDAYSLPILVLSSSIVALGNLPSAPAIGLIDENYNLTLNWNPPTIDGNYQAYRAWNIWLTLLPGGQPQLQSVNGALPTGLEPSGTSTSSREFARALIAGDWDVNMQALTADTSLALNSNSWDNPHEFPAALTTALVTFDNNSVDNGQTVTISLDPNYTGADVWQAIYPDGTTSGWMPISTKTLAKTMSLTASQQTGSGVNQQIIIQTLRDYSTALPSVKLLRQVTKTIYVMNQQYQATTASTTITGTLGIGGQQGFEVTNATAQGATLAPYEVITRALVRNSLTNELKLMIAASRTPDASSLLGTMAIDVFPIAGRPRVASLVKLPDYLSLALGLAANPTQMATTTLPNVIVGKPMSDFPMQVTSNTGVAPFSWYADSLPFGLKLSKSGVLSGTAVALGNYAIDFSVIDSNSPPFIAHATLTLAVETDLSIPALILSAATVGTPYGASIGSTGGIPPYTWSIVAGAPPLGITLDPSTGTLSGTPVTYNSTSDFSKTYVFTAQVVDAIGAIATATFTLTLLPASLSFGNLDQTTIFAGEAFSLAIPIFGGQAPYSFSAFTDDGTIGNGLRIVNPTSISAIAGVEPPSLAIATANQGFFPATYPFNPSFVLEATGGVAPYHFAVVPGANTTLPGAEVSGFILTSLVSADGSYTVAIQCTDSTGLSTTQAIPVAVRKQNDAGYAIKPVSIGMNGSNNPANWTVTPLTAFPDAQAGAAYNSGGSGTYYGLGLYFGGAPCFSQGGTPMNFSIRSGSLPQGIFLSSANAAAGATMDFSGLQLINVSGGSNPTVLGSSSFEGEFSNVVGTSGAVTQVVARQSITVTPTGTGSTPVVVLLSNEAYTVDLSSANSSPYPWFYPTWAEGGQAPYTISLQSGTTLPGATITTLNGFPALASNTTAIGSYVVKMLATDANGVVSAVATIPITIVETLTEPIHIVGSNLPTYVYANRALPANTYFVQSDLIAAWAASGLPAGISISTAPGTKAYLSGTPTATGAVTATITATSAAYGTTASTPASFTVRPQTAVIINAPASATLGVAYRTVTNNAILQVQYTGYHPGDSSLPILASLNGSVGAPGVLNNNTATTSVSSLTSDGFIMSFDYICSVAGTDTILLGSSIGTLNLPVTYPAIVLTGATATSTISEYAVTASFAIPATAIGGLNPTITVTGFSDSRFSLQNGQIAVSVDSLPVGQTTSCTVSLLATDSVGDSATATGTLQVTVQQQTYIQVNFSNANWNVNVSSGIGFTSILIPNQEQSVPVLGHSPYQFYIDSVVLPPALIGFVAISPSQRVLAIQCNSTSASASVPDVNASLNNSGTFVVPAVAPVVAPAAGSYQIPLVLRVVDVEGISSSQTVTTTLVIS